MCQTCCFDQLICTRQVTFFSVAMTPDFSIKILIIADTILATLEETVCLREGKKSHL